MRRSYRSAWLAIFAVAVLSPRMDHAGAQQVGLAAIDMNEAARGYRADALKLKTVTNDKGETVGRISDFIFSKDGNNIFVVLAVGDFTGLSGHLVAVPFRSLKLDDSGGDIVLPGASRAALEKLPVLLNKR